MRVVVSLVTIGIVLVLVACGGESTIKITGSVLIENPSRFQSDGGACSGADVLAEVQEGAEVTVQPNEDEVATTTLSAGAVTEEGNCRLLFIVEVPDKDAPKRYDFRVAGLPPVMGIVNTTNPIEWQSADSDGWVTIGWD
jgi:hypothetical protein